MGCMTTRKSHEAYFDFFITSSKTEGAPGNSSQCHVAAWMGGQFGGGWICMYTYTYVYVYVWIRMYMYG